MCIRDRSMYWSGLYSPSSQFLSHEWSKHGSCWEDDIQADGEQQEGVVESFLELHRRSRKNRRNNNRRNNGPKPPSFNPHARVDPAELRIQKDWISQVINVGTQYGIYNILAKKDIVPDDDAQYNTQDIRQAVVNELGIQNFDLGCIRKNNQQYIGEIHICLDRQYKPIDCPLKRERRNNCAENQPVGYPSFDKYQGDALYRSLSFSQRGRLFNPCS
eukprot:TRINITY_DN7143_c0_g1_i1.p1 TRINITY_DN7143_c0_g1~~TRINITY_DN7143_c0_g1_i1.p1  ORF type:complete len:249 (-),score=62.87 TRINITY_DN7143_c0_g1_i1:269-919(-)